MPDASGFFDVVLGQRACRWFADDDVPDADLARMLEAATHAPSAENAQPWAFVVVRDPAVRRAVDDVARRNWAAGGRAHVESRLSPALLADVEAGIDAGHGGAPVVIVVAGDVEATSARVLPSSLFPAVQNLLLAAMALGYGSAMTTLAAADPAALREAVGLPEHLLPFAVVPVGRPARRLAPPRRQPVAAKSHLDRWGTPFPP